MRRLKNSSDISHFAAHTVTSNLLFIPIMLQSRKRGKKASNRNEVQSSEASWTKLYICLSCKKLVILFLPVWRCNGVKICLHEERTTTAMSLYHTLSCALQPLVQNLRKAAWNSCLLESYLLNASCLAGSWNNRWIKGSRKITLSGAENRSWEASTRNSPKIDIIFCKKKNSKGLLGGEREGMGKKSQTKTLGYSEISLRNFDSKYVLYQLSWIICPNMLDVNKLVIY